MGALPSPASTSSPRIVGQGVKLIAKLETVRRCIDEKFLAACELLSQSINGIENLIFSLDRLAEALDAETVAETTGDLQAAASKLLSLPVGRAERVARIGRLNKCREEFAEHVSDMRCSLAYMRAFTTGLKLDAADQHDKLNALVHDISGCVEKGAEELKKLEFELASLQMGLEEAMAQGEILEFQISQLLPMLPEDITYNAKVMGNHYLRVVSTAGSVAALARDIHQRVTRILSALQIGDITRQRIEHIQAGIILIDTSDKLLMSEQRDRITATLFALLAAQLSAATSDFHREVTEVGQSMIGMAADARELLRLHDMTYGGGDGTQDGFLRIVADQIQRARGLVEDLDKAEHTALEMGRDTANVAQELSTRVEAILEIKTRLRELVSDSQNLPPEAIASESRLQLIISELREYESLLDDAAGESIGIADRLAKSAAALVRDGALSDDRETSIAGALDVATNRICDARDKTEKDISAIVAKGDEVLNMLDMSSNRLDFQRGIGEVLDQVTGELTNLGGKAVPIGNGGDGGEQTTLVDTLLMRMAKFYSMTQEREVHRSFVLALGFNASEPTPAEFSDDDFENILF
jgi:hypothetical protein